MPVVIDQADWPVWLGEESGNYASLVKPPAEDLLESWPVRNKVNSPRNNGPELLEHQSVNIDRWSDI
jgi:putative SOS response-associated peptidase YedK